MKIKTLNFDKKKKNDVYVVKLCEIKHKTISDISKLFINHNRDIIVITKEGKPYYLLTATDIIDSLVAHYDNMTIINFIDKNPKKIISVNEEESLFDAYRLMRSYKIHHLIVVNEKGEFSKVINFYDFASFLTEMALKDDLTGLYNRRFFDFLLDKYKDADIEVGVVFIDLDKFKKLNDTYGHAFGDKILKKVASIIRTSIRDIDYAFRLGGDEFVILVFASSEILSKISERIKEKIKSTKIDGVSISCSIGYAHYPTESKELHEAVNLADERMYKDKKKRD